MSKTGSMSGGAKGSGVSGMSNTSSFHASHMQQSQTSMVPPGGAVHAKPFRSYVQADKQKVQVGAQTKGWVQSRVQNRAIAELNEVRETIVRMAFAKLDKNGSGEITIDDLKGVYDCSKHPAVKSGAKTEDDVLGEFLAKFEVKPIKDGIVSWDEFLQYYKQMSADIPHDDYFVLLLRKAWQI
jgi:hypothetical protein